jgi:hypothetical protein
VIRLLHRGNDCLDIQRPDRPQVDDFNLDAIFLFQNLGSFQCMGDVLAVGNDGNVGTFLFNLGLADREDKVFGSLFSSQRERNTVQQLVFEEADRVRVSDGSLYQMNVVNTRNPERGYGE